MRRVSIWVPGHPVPQPRMTQATKWKLRDHPVWAWRDRVAWAVKAHRTADWPVLWPVKMGFDFKVLPNRGQIGDLDNYIKACKDALTGVLYKNDRQVRGYLEPTGIEKVDKGDPEGVALIVQY